MRETVSTYPLFFSADLYVLTGEILGKGTHSSVTTCLHKYSKNEFAVKVVPKSSDCHRDRVLREVEILYMCRDNRCGDDDVTMIVLICNMLYLCILVISEVFFSWWSYLKVLSGKRYKTTHKKEKGSLYCIFSMMPNYIISSSSSYPFHTHARTHAHTHTVSILSLRRCVGVLSWHTFRSGRGSQRGRQVK